MPKMTLAELAEFLVTWYEEVKLYRRGGDEPILRLSDGPRPLKSDLADVEMLAGYAWEPVESIDCYYDGDHMVLEIRLAP